MPPYKSFDVVGKWRTSRRVIVSLRLDGVIIFDGVLCARKVRREITTKPLTIDTVIRIIRAFVGNISL